MTFAPALNGLSEFDKNPNIIFKALPFYHVLREIIPPTCLIPSCTRNCEKIIEFSLGGNEIKEINYDQNVQVQFRIALLEHSFEHKDKIPGTFDLKVNDVSITLPRRIQTWVHIEGERRPDKPIDITPALRKKEVNLHMMKIQWISQRMEPYVFTVRKVRKVDSSALLQQLNHRFVRNPDYTRAIIIEKFQDDLSVGLENLNISLICPLGKRRMRLPCRSRSCTHIQCFDAAVYVEMNERREKWHCPICGKPAEFDTVLIDGLFLEITKKLPPECTTIQFRKDGSWISAIPKKITPESEKAISSGDEAKSTDNIEIVVLDSDNDNEDIYLPCKKKKE